jgi:hypothetical protein
VTVVVDNEDEDDDDGEPAVDAGDEGPVLRETERGELRTGRGGEVEEGEEDAI